MTPGTVAAMQAAATDLYADGINDGELLRDQIADGLEHNLHLIAGLGLLRS